jgi:hypothetical protein
MEHVIFWLAYRRQVVAGRGVCGAKSKIQTGRCCFVRSFSDSASNRGALGTVVMSFRNLAEIIARHRQLLRTAICSASQPRVHLKVALLHC